MDNVTKKHIIVVSIDAMVFEDLEYARQLPSFAKILDGASMVERVKTIYPSLTHPAHASIMTGCPPSVTGITSNTVFNPECPDDSGAPWYNSLSDLKCDTLLHAAKRAGLTVAVSSWPLTGHGEDVVDYLVLGILNRDFIGYEDDPLEAYRAWGASDEVIDIIADAGSKFGYGDYHPSVDEFQMYCSVHIIKRYKPNLLLTHPSYVDNRRHAAGVFGDEVKKALVETDRWLGMLIDAVREAGIEDETDFVLLSDHGHINITRTMSPNVYLRDKGYIRCTDDGKVLSYDAYAKGVGASAQVYLARQDDPKLYADVYRLLSDMAEEGIYGFERVYTASEAESLGLSGNFSFILEGDGYTSFGDWAIRPAVRGFDKADYRFGRGTHGHLPEKGPQPVFIANGPSFRSGVTVPYGSVLDHAPTIAAALGITLPEAMGSKVVDILR